MDDVRWGVQVEVDMADGDKQIWGKWLENPLPQVPFPGDVIALRAAHVSTQMTGVDDAGNVTVEKRWDGTVRQVTLEVDRRLWHGSGTEMVLLCWPYPGQSDMDPVDIVAGLEENGFVLAE